MTKGEILHQEEDFHVELLSDRDPTDPRVIYTEMFRRTILELIDECSHVTLFREMQGADQVACIQSGVLGALGLYVATVSRDKETFDKVTEVMIKALPTIMNASAEQMAKRLRAIGRVPKHLT